MPNRVREKPVAYAGAPVSAASAWRFWQDEPCGSDLPTRCWRLWQRFDGQSELHGVQFGAAMAMPMLGARDKTGLIPCRGSKQASKAAANARRVSPHVHG